MHTSEDIINKTILFVKETLTNAEGGHDWFHIERVYKNSLLIAKKEPVDLFIVSLSALLHDIADSKFHNGDETIGPKIAREFLFKLNVDSKVIEHVIKIIENISFKSSLSAGRGRNEAQKFKSLELDVVQDADRLDAIGAIGIARTFNYGGFKNRALYNPEIKPHLNMTSEEYKSSTAPTINHFYEKLLLLKDKMNTKTGKQLADKRHDFMELYLNQFYSEWEGNA
ncbi:HD domain-containing protein [Algibacter sp. 2305UL17-15]|uniref:HD domain-containing protein n=1 Tax=Algibacter sp. 2305UL17-15 TaxID=3231268 RepID=UPI0034580E9A